jgi:hypothetical protein
MPTNCDGTDPLFNAIEQLAQVPEPTWKTRDSMDGLSRTIGAMGAIDNDLFGILQLLADRLAFAEARIAEMAGALPPPVPPVREEDR